jgi:DNA-binding GntR family transcriptional regulator
VAEPESSLQSDTVYLRIKQAILALEFRPGERISERRLETLLQASRTPVRAALLRLETEDLVRRDGNSWQVTPLDYEELTEAFDFRILIELDAVARATKFGTEVEFDRLAAILTQSEIELPPENFLPRTALFHVEIARMAHSRFLVRSITSVLQRLVRMRMLILTFEATRPHAEDDHRSIAAAIRSGNVEQASALMRRHLEWSRDQVVQGMTERRKRNVIQGRGATLL